MEHGQAEVNQMNKKMTQHHYVMLGINLAISLLIMYLVMFSMIWSGDDFFNNSNMFYMALLMWGPMGILMLLTMGMMYQNRQLNILLYAFFALLILVSFWAIRDQALVGDRQFARAMIPHHSGAITMCERASLRDPAMKEICFKPNGIVASQVREIAELKAFLERK